jgi:hypothetical protein
LKKNEKEKEKEKEKEEKEKEPCYSHVAAMVVSGSACQPCSVGGHSSGTGQ